MHKTLRISGLLIALIAASSQAGAVRAQSEEEQPPAKAALSTNVKRITQQIGDWTLDCTERAGDRKRCKMIQKVGTSKSKQIILSWLIGRDNEGREVMSFQTPTGMLLKPGVAFAVDDRGLLQVEFRTCTPQFCEAVSELTDDTVAAMKAGGKATLTLTPLNAKPVALNMSLKGFTAAYMAYKSE